MSERLVMHVWKTTQGMEGSKVLVLLALAEWADDEGNVEVSMPELSQTARQSERNVQYWLKKLEEESVIFRHAQSGRGRKSYYKLSIETPQPLHYLLHESQQIAQPLRGLEEETPQKVQPLHYNGIIPPLVLPSQTLPSLSPLPGDLSGKNREKIPPLPPSQESRGDEQEPHQVSSSKTKRTKKPKTTDERALRILSHLNAITGREYRDTSQIETALKAGQTEDDCLVVLDWLHEVRRRREPDWCEKYLDNTTPFRQSHFDKFRAAATQWHAQGRKIPGQQWGTTRASPQEGQATGSPTAARIKAKFYQRGYYDSQ